MNALTDAARLVAFVVWEMRTGDLPPDVKEAARRMAPHTPRPAHYGDNLIRVTEGPLIIDGMTNLDEDGVDRRRAYPHQAGRVIQDLLAQGRHYILVQDRVE